jgi:hypothetical protein
LQHACQAAATAGVQLLAQVNAPLACNTKAAPQLLPPKPQQRMMSVHLFKPDQAVLQLIMMILEALAAHQ